MPECLKVHKKQSLEYIQIKIFALTCVYLLKLFKNYLGLTLAVFKDTVIHIFKQIHLLSSKVTNPRFPAYENILYLP